MSQKSKINIVVPCYNAHSTLDRLLSSVAMQTIKDTVKVILVNDKSEKDYSEFIFRFKIVFFAGITTLVPVIIMY